VNPAIHDLLRSLYGPPVARELLPRLQQLLDRFRAAPPQPPASPQPDPGLTEQDALLIAYADQLLEPGAPPLQTLAGFAQAHLDGVVSGIHVLPFYPWSSDDGFAVKDYFAVDPAYGGWPDIARLGQSFDLMLDAVFNHMSIQGEWFQRFIRDEPEFRDFFVTVEGEPDLSQVVRPRALPLLTEFATARGPRRVWTTFSADQADLNFGNPRVLLAVLEALLFYAARGARFIRLDAIAFLWKEIGTPCLHQPQTHAVIQIMRAVLDEAAPRVRLITETNVPHADNISYFGDGANEAQLVYNFALPPLVLHSFATGSAAALTRWARPLAAPAGAAFFNFLASHDGIGLNPARGILSDAQIDALADRSVEHGGFISWKAMPDGSRKAYELNINYLDALSNPKAGEPVETAARKFLTAHAILLSLQGVPAIYFHSLFGSRGDRPGADASGMPRRINRQKLDRASLEAELSRSGSLRSRIFGGCKDLLRIRRAHPAFHPQAAQRVIDLDPRLFAVCRIPAGQADPMLCLHNVSGETVAIGELPPEARLASAWTDPATGRCYRPGGRDAAPLRLDGFQTLWLRAAAAV